MKVSEINEQGVFFLPNGKATQEGIVLIRTVNELLRRLGGTAGSSTLADLGTPTAPAVKLCTNETGGATLVFADGTNWRRVQDRVVAS